MDWSVAIIVWVLCAVGSFFIATTKGAPNAVTWAIWGFILGPFGVLATIIFAKPKATPASSAPTVVMGAADELTKLITLRDAGHITEDEFARQRAALFPAVMPTQTPVWDMNAQAPAGSLCGRCGKPLSPVWRGRCNHCGGSYAEHNPVPRAV